MRVFLSYRTKSSHEKRGSRWADGDRLHDQSHCGVGRAPSLSSCLSPECRQGRKGIEFLQADLFLLDDDNTAILHFGNLCSRAHVNTCFPQSPHAGLSISGGGGGKHLGE